MKTSFELSQPWNLLSACIMAVCYMAFMALSLIEEFAIVLTIPELIVCFIGLILIGVQCEIITHYFEAVELDTPKVGLLAVLSNVCQLLNYGLFIAAGWILILGFAL